MMPFGFEIFVSEEQPVAGVAQVPVNGIGQQAQETVGAHAIPEVVVDGADLPVRRFQGSKRPLDVTVPV